MSKGSGGRPGGAMTGMNPWSAPNPVGGSSAFTGKPQVNGGAGSMGVFTGKPEINGGARSGGVPMQLPPQGGYGKPQVNVMPQMGPDGPMMPGPMGVPMQRPMRGPVGQMPMRGQQQMPMQNPMARGPQQIGRPRLAETPNLMGYRR